MSKLPPVTLLLRYFTIGGLERVVSSLANSYVERGIDTQIIVMSTGKRNSLITELDPRINVVLLSGSLHQKLTMLRKLTQGHLVHIHFGDGKIHPLIRTALHGRKVVVTYHSVYSHKRTWLVNRCDQFWASRAAGIIAVSNAVKKFCVEEVHIPAERVQVIQNGVEIRPTPNQTSEDGSVVFLSLASLYPHKNHIALLDGLAKAKEMGVPAKLRMIGDGPVMASLYQHCVALGLRSDVEWYGAVWHRDFVQGLIASSHGFISASKYEGLPISILEGMAHGLPMILSDIPPHREVAGDAALYFPLGDPEAMASQIKYFVENESKQTEMRKGSLEQIKRFELTRCVDAYLEVYAAVARQIQPSGKE